MSENKYGICCGGDRIDLPNDCYATIETKHDEDMGPPWKEHDGHGVVSEWTRRDKRPGERVLASDRWDKRYYDFAATTVIAKRDGWGLCQEKLDALTRRLGRKPTKNEVVAAAVEHDYDFLYGWANDQWSWIGVVVKLFDADDNELGHDSLWGIESEGDYWKEVASEMLENLIEKHDREVEESAYWAARDVITA